MSFRHLPLLTALIVALSCAAGASSQDSEDNEIPLINLKFAGGSAADYVAAVQRAAGGVNVFVAREASMVPTPAVELQNVTIAAALGVLHDHAYIDNRSQIKLTYEEGGAFAPNERPIYRITARVGGGMAVEMQNRVWSVAALQASDVSAEDMLTAVQTAIDLIGKEQPEPQIRFHEATGVLIARATREQLDSINQVIDQLNVSAGLRRVAAEIAAQPDQDRAQMRQQLHEQADIIRQLRERITELEAQLAKTSGR